MTLLIAALLFLGINHSLGQSLPTMEAADSRDQRPVGTGLAHFNRVDEGVYKGSKPRSDADYRFLQSLHVKYMVDLRVIPWLYQTEERNARRYGIELMPVQMNASPVSPSEKHIETVLAILRDRRCHPIYFHCALGRDRTALIAALYFWTTLSRTLLFWAAFILTRPLGAVVGDFLDKPVANGGLAFGRFYASAILAALIVALIVFVPQRAGNHSPASQEN